MPAEDSRKSMLRGFLETDLSVRLWLVGSRKVYRFGRSAGD
jgi:hypothetical protein